MTYIKRLKELNFNSLGKKTMTKSGRGEDVTAAHDVCKELTNGRKGQGGYFHCSVQI